MISQLFYTLYRKLKSNNGVEDILNTSQKWLKFSNIAICNRIIKTIKSFNGCKGGDIVIRTVVPIVMSTATAFITVV